MHPSLPWVAAPDFILVFICYYLTNRFELFVCTWFMLPIHCNLEFWFDQRLWIGTALFSLLFFHIFIRNEWTDLVSISTVFRIWHSWWIMMNDKCCTNNTRNTNSSVAQTTLAPPTTVLQHQPLLQELLGSSWFVMHNIDLQILADKLQIICLQWLTTDVRMNKSSKF